MLVINPTCWWYVTCYATLADEAACQHSPVVRQIVRRIHIRAGLRFRKPALTWSG